MADNIIEVRNLTKKFGQQIILDDISFTVAKGDIYGFLGRNGSGKSTTMKAILKLLKMDTGSIRVFGGTDINHNRTYLGSIGALIEEPSFYPNLTGYENLKIIQKLAHLPLKNIDQVLNIVNLEDSANILAKNYSLGMKQRLGIAMALIKFPKLLILDEPTNGLDPEGVKEIRELIKSLPKKYDMTIFISSHILSEIEKMVNKIAIIDQGKIKFEGTINAISQGNELTVTVDNLKRADAILSENNYELLKLDKNIIIKNISPENAIVINRLLVEAGIGVSNLHIENDSLEDLFLKITEGV